MKTNVADVWPLLSPSKTKRGGEAAPFFALGYAGPSRW